MSAAVGKENRGGWLRAPAAARYTDATTQVVAGTLSAISLLGLMLVFFVKLPPLVDYPNHLARMWIIARLPHEQILQRFYEIHWKLIPDLAMDLVVPPFIRLFGIWLAGKLFIGLALLLTISGTAALGWSIHRRLSPSLVCIPSLLFSTLFLLGFLNFFFSVGLALWGAALAMRLRNSHPAWRVLTSATFALILYCCHLYGLGLYGLILLSFEAARWREARQGRMWRAVLFCLPFICPFVILLANMGRRMDSSVLFSLSTKPTGLIFVVGGYGDLFAFFAITFVSIVLIAKRNDMSVPGPLKYFLGIGIAAWLVMPFVLFGSAYADSRLPLLLVIVALSMIDLRLDRSEVAVFCALLATLTLARYGVIARIWHEQAATFAQFEQSFEAMPPGSRILTATTHEPDEPYSPADMSMIHMPSAAIIERSDFVTLEFTSPQGQILRVHPALQSMKPTSAAPAYIGNVISETPDMTASNPSARGYWIGWRRKFDAVYLLDAPPGTRSPSPYMQLIYQGDHFQLYRVSKDSPTR